MKTLSDVLIPERIALQRHKYLAYALVENETVLYVGSSTYKALVQR